MPPGNTMSEFIAENRGAMLSPDLDIVVFLWWRFVSPV